MRGWMGDLMMRLTMFTMASTLRTNMISTCHSNIHHTSTLCVNDYPLIPIS